LFRKDEQTYAEVAESAQPDVLIEDDCESIGGKDEMTYTHIKPEIQEKIKLVAIEEFGGIDQLPENIGQLITRRSMS
jgi:hypothetical protein